MSSRREGGELPEIVLTRRCEADPEVVYDVVADLETHLEWAGRRQWKSYRLESIDAPPGPASVGTEFSSTGRDPGGTFSDRSVVTEARRPAVFEFVTEARLSPKRGDRATAWTLVNRYEITRAREGCRVTYRSHVIGLAPAPLYARVRLLRGVAIRIPKVFMRRGLRNLTRFVEERAAERSAA